MNTPTRNMIETEYSPGLNRLNMTIFNMISEGHHADLRKIIADYLRWGISNQEFLNIAADMLDPPKNGRGRPKTEIPKLHLYIGIAYEGLQNKGVGPRPERIKILGKRFKMSTRSIEKSLAYVRKQAQLIGISVDTKDWAVTYYQRVMSGECIPPHLHELWMKFGPEYDRKGWLSGAHRK
jgi:hypothetical protein